jgi:hypothetical protein
MDDQHMLRFGSQHQVNHQQYWNRKQAARQARSRGWAASAANPSMES